MTECNVENRTIFCDDNLGVLRGINSECIDLIYLDPPFNKNKKFTAPIGSSADGAEFSDIFREEDVKSEWLLTIREDHSELYHYLNGIRGVGNSYNFAYLAYMAIRLIDCRRVLKPTGSLYLHCDPTMSHYLKTLMDCIFGEDNFRNEIVWTYRTGGAGRKTYGRKHDIILWYSAGKTWTFNIQKERSYLTGQMGHRKSDDVLTDEHGSYQEVVFSKTQIKLYKDERGYYTMVNCRDYWPIDSVGRSSAERLGYPTQKPLALLERIIAASSNPDDMVLDPFCGCATTCVAAERLGRKWIGIDISIKAYELVQERLTREAADPGDLLKYQNKIHLKTDPPKRTDQGEDYRERKFVYVISHPAYPGEYKVGIAKDWKSRLNAYQTFDPDRQYKIEFKMETPYFRETELFIHNKFPNKHEWVQGNLKDIVNEIRNYRPVEQTDCETF